MKKYLFIYKSEVMSNLQYVFIGYILCTLIYKNEAGK